MILEEFRKKYEKRPRSRLEEAAHDAVNMDDNVLLSDVAEEYLAALSLFRQVLDDYNIEVE